MTLSDPSPSAHGFDRIVDIESGGDNDSSYIDEGP